MNAKNILNSLNKNKKSFSLYERKPGKYQLTVPILHEDGDMVDMYLQKSPKGANYVRICDFGMSIQRLSYSYEINTASKEKIFKSILLNNGIQEDNGNLYLDTPIDKIYESVFQFAGCSQKVCSMDYWGREIAQSTFYKDLKDFVLNKLTKFNPEPDTTPLLQTINKTSSDDKVFKADWSLKCNKRQFYLFGVSGSNKAKDTAIALLEFKKANLSFISLVVHNDMQILNNKDTVYLTKTADKQYPQFSDFNEGGKQDIQRMAS